MKEMAHVRIFAKFGKRGYNSHTASERGLRCRIAHFTNPVDFTMGLSPIQSWKDHTYGVIS